jgi:hypothetical protein
MESLMPRRNVALLVPVLLIAFTTAAGAQTRPLVIVEDAETLEIGGDFGLMKFDGGPVWGGHVTRNVTRWMAGEVSVHGAHSHDGPVRSDAFGSVTANLRIGGRVTFVAREPHELIVFGTVGAARAFGLSYRYSPVVGVGVQDQGDSRTPVAWRVDFQRLTNGWALDDGVRLTFGIVIVP